MNEAFCYKVLVNFSKYLRVMTRRNNRNFYNFNIRFFIQENDLIFFDPKIF